MSNTDGNSNVPKLPDLKFSDNTVSQALSSITSNQGDLKLSKLTLDQVVGGEPRQPSPRSPRRLTQITELKDEFGQEIKPRLRRVSNRERTSESSSSTNVITSSNSTTTTTIHRTTTSSVERSITSSSSEFSPKMDMLNMPETSSALISSSFSTNAIDISNEKQYADLEQSIEQFSSMLKEVNEIKSVQDERNQKILEKNQNLVDIINQRRQKIQRIYHLNYLKKKAFLRKKRNNQIKYMYQKRQRDIEILQLEKKKMRQKKYLQLKKYRQDKLRKGRLLQIKQREAQIEQVQAYYLRKRELQKEKLLLQTLNSKVTNYSQTEDPSIINDDYYSDDYYSDDEHEIVLNAIQERGIDINLVDENQNENQRLETTKIESNNEHQTQVEDISTKKSKEDDIYVNQASEKDAQVNSSGSDFTDLFIKIAICVVLAATVFRAFQVSF